MLIGHTHLLLTNRRCRVTIGADASCSDYHVARRQKERLSIKPEECLHSPYCTKNEKTSGCPPLIFSPILQLKRAGRSSPNQPRANRYRSLWIITQLTEFVKMAAVDKMPTVSMSHCTSSSWTLMRPSMRLSEPFVVGVCVWNRPLV
jgi:hypothetical protein